MLRNLKLIMVAFVLTLAGIESVEAQNRVFDNGRLRYGTGVENSVNALGNLQQPFYYSAVYNGWRKLTFANYPLDIRWGVGGDGTNNWNINGSMVTNPTVTNPNYDYTDFIITNAATGAGYGKIVFSGNITVNSQLLLVENTYELLENEGYIDINVKVTNQSGSPADNVRLWFGTRDDYLGNDDTPTKERGNLVDGAFQVISTQSEQSKAVKISTNDEATLFYSTSDRAYTTIDGCCSFENATNENPATNIISVNNDGSYALYAKFNDLANGESDEITIYYAGGALNEIDDIIAQVAAASSLVQNITYTSAEFSYSFPEDGTTSLILVPDGSTAPTDAQIIAGVDYAGVTVVADSTLATLADTVYTFSFDDLPAGTTYEIYAVTVYTDDDNNVVNSEIASTDFTTTPNDLPVGSGIVNQTGCKNDVFTGLSLSITDEFPGTDVFIVTAASSNTALVPVDSIEITGTGASRTIDVNPVLEASGTATITISMEDADGGVGTYDFDVTINNGHHTTAVDTQLVCTPTYTWINGTTYTESNYTDQFTLVSAAGCDSVVTLHLTMAEPTYSTHTVTAAGSYTWMNGVTYTAAINGPTHTLTNAAGCDSVITLNLSINPYCSLRSTRVNFEWIKDVELGDDIDNATGKESGGYGYYSGDTLVVDTSDVVSINLLPGYRRRVYTEYWRMWVDWNYDGDFDDAGEKVFEQKGKNLRTGSFTVPVNVSPNDLRVRVAMRWRRYAPSCGTFRSGEVEDYVLRVNGAQGYTGTIEETVILPPKMAEEVASGDLYEFSELYPNPVTNNGTVSGYIRVEQTGVKQLFVVNTLGKVVKTVAVDCTEDENLFEISTDGLAKGIYFINVEGGAETTKLIVQ